MLFTARYNSEYYLKIFLTEILFTHFFMNKILSAVTKIIFTLEINEHCFHFRFKVPVVNVNISQGKYAAPVF